MAIATTATTAASVLIQAAATTAEGVPNWLIQTWVMSFGVIIVLLLLIVVKRHYEHMAEPSKKHPFGQMIMEIWKKTGPRVRYSVDLKANGMEVIPPFQKDGEQDNRYFFTQRAKGSTKWPDWLPFAWLKATMPVASWLENQSVAIDPDMDECPHCGKEVIVAKDALPADMQALLQETDTMATGAALMKDAASRDEEMRSLGRLNPKLITGLLFAAVALAAAGAILAFQAMTAAQTLVGG